MNLFDKLPDHIKAKAVKGRKPSPEEVEQGRRRSEEIRLFLVRLDELEEKARKCVLECY